MMEKPVSSEEILVAIKHLKPNKTPGMDGLPGEFYKRFQIQLVEPLADTCNHILGTGILTPLWVDANIIVIPKPDREPTKPKVYYLISLLNQDYKIFTSVLVNHLNSSVSQYINSDQSGFIPKHSITDNFRRTFNFIFCLGLICALSCLVRNLQK